MKKFVLLSLIACSVFRVSAQKGLEWIQIDNPKDDYVFKYFYNYSENGFKAIFTIPQIKPFQSVKNQIFIRTYDAGLNNYTEEGIPAESPYELNVKAFKDYTVVVGSTDENKNPFLQYHKDNKLIVADAQMNTLLNISFPVHGKKNKFTGLPSSYKSYDSTHLIVTNTEILETESKAFHETPEMHYINIYDKSLNLVWMDSVRFDDIFGKDVPISSYSFNYINDNVFLEAYTGGAPTKKVKPEFFVVKFDSPHKSKIILRKVLQNNSFSWETRVDKSSRMSISGLNYSEGMGAKKSLFFVTIDLKNEGGETPVKIYNIDKPFLAKYPEYKSKLPEFLAGPSDLIPVKDGLIYCSEYHMVSTTTTSSSSSTTYYLKGISLIKFDYEGNIEWIKILDKTTATKSGYYPLFCRAFASKGNIVLFYYDYEDHIFMDKASMKLRFVSDNGLCLVQAKIDADGNIKKTFVGKIGEDGTKADLRTLWQVGDSRFFVEGNGVKIKTRGNFVSFYEVAP
jgi:hypothetical protein